MGKNQKKKKTFVNRKTVKDEPKPSQPAKQRMKLVLVGTPM
jgi:hypothetical protein